MRPKIKLIVIIQNVLFFVKILLKGTFRNNMHTPARNLSITVLSVTAIRKLSSVFSNSDSGIAIATTVNKDHQTLGIFAKLNCTELTVA